jgi:hypothetical protein
LEGFVEVQHLNKFSIFTQHNTTEHVPHGRRSLALRILSNRCGCTY